MNTTDTQPQPSPIRPQNSDILELEIWSELPPISSEQKIEFVAEVKRKFFM